LVVERAPELGGRSRLAELPPGRTPLGRQRADLLRALGASGARVATGTSVTAELIRAERPDVVVIAVGARTRVPKRFRSLVGDRTVVPFDEVLAGTVEAGDPVVIWGGGGAAARTADHLAIGLRKKVTVITRQKALASGLVLQERGPLLNRLAEHGVELVTAVREVKTITSRSITFIDEAGAERRLDAATIVLAIGAEPDPTRDEILAWLNQADAPLAERYVIGDALAPARLWSAYQDGVSLGLRI